ncbi:MAG: flagellin FliC [Thermoleophilia bacterium]|nr:flagellin FliC [Thermoleophilia bacterium]
MGLSIQNNVSAFNTHRLLNANSTLLSKSMAKLSSGFRINSAADDAAGLGISEKMRGQISGITQASRNVQDGISLASTAEGSMQEISAILLRVRDLAVQFNSGTQSAAGKAAITAEVTQLNSEVTSLISRANYNGITLLAGGSVTLQVGANGTDTLGVTFANATTAVGTSISSFASASAATVISITGIDASIDSVSTARATYGAVQNRLEHTANALGIYQENLMAAESRIRDVDMAEEMTNYTKLQILQQSGTAMLAQANSNSASVLSLFK